MGNKDASISDVARAVFTLTCVLSMGRCIYAAPTCVPPVLKTNQIALCNPNGSAVLWDCPACPPGSGLSVECGQVYELGMKIDCVPCKKGVEYSSTHDIGQCKQCTKCHENEEETRSCEVNSDRSCTCKAEHYRDNILKDCKPCSWCCGDNNDQYITECKAMPQGKHCAFKVNGKSCAPTTSIPITTVTTTATPVETTTSQEPLDTKTKRQVHVNKTSYDPKNTTGSPDTVLPTHETSENMPLYIFYIVGAVSLIVILVLGAVICWIFLKSGSSTSTNNSAVNSQTTSSVELNSSVPLLTDQQPSPQKPLEDTSANKIQIRINDGTAIYINEAGKDGNQETIEQSMPATAAEDEDISTSCLEDDSTICYTQDGTLQNCPENIHNAGKKQSLEVTQLPSQVYAEVCRMLNAKEPFFRDYRVLAEKLGVSKEDIEKLEENKSPTNALFLKHKVTIKTLMEILKSIDREDVVKVIEVWLNN